MQETSEHNLGSSSQQPTSQWQQLIPQQQQQQQQQQQHQQQNNADSGPPKKSGGPSQAISFGALMPLLLPTLQPDQSQKLLALYQKLKVGINFNVHDIFSS